MVLWTSAQGRQMIIGCVQIKSVDMLDTSRVVSGQADFQADSSIAEQSSEAAAKATDEHDHETSSKRRYRAARKMK